MFGTLFDTQVFPEFVEVKIEFLAATASLLPSADEATPEQFIASREVFHVTPEFVEV